MAKILIVDDVNTEVMLMQKALAPSNHTLITASDGVAALEMVQKEKPDLVLLDIVLPKLDGFQVCRRIRKNPDSSETPVILISSKSQASDRFWGMKQGATDYLTKPYDQGSLVDTVQQHV